MTARRTTLLALLLGLALAPGLMAAGAFAQTPPSRIRGTIATADANSMTVTPRNGSQVSVQLPADLKVAAVTTGQIADIKPGSFIGTAAVPLPDGSLKALEVTVFPPEMNGTGEGHYGWDLAPSSTMTNGTVGDLVTSEGRVMTVKYKGGEKKIVVPDDVPVVMIEPGSPALLTPGTHVVVFAAKAADGTLTAARVIAGKNGAVPPM